MTTGWPFCWCCLCQDKAQTLLQLHRSGSIDTAGWINSALIWTQPKAFIFSSAKASCTWTFLLRRLISCLGSSNSYTLLTFSYPYKTFALCCNNWDSTKMQKLGEKLWKPGWYWAFHQHKAEKNKEVNTRCFTRTANSPGQCKCTLNIYQTCAPGCQKQQSNLTRILESYMLTKQWTVFAWKMSILHVKKV